MKRVVCLTVATVLAASMAFAQGGSIGIFADPMGTNCNLGDVAGLTQYYVVHVNSPGATACQFSAPKPACFTATYLADTGVFAVTVGTSQAGVSIGYGLCLQSPLKVLTISYFTNGGTPSCCYYPVLGHPTATPPGLLVVNCMEQLIPATGGRGIIKPSLTCQCNVPAEDTTWGQVKSLYVE